MTDQLISYFNAGEFSKVGGEVSFEDYLDGIQDGRWQDPVLSVRAGKLDKKKVPSVTVSGTFDGRRQAQNLKLHSGVIGIDIDADDNEELELVREALQADPYCHACHHSVRGFGLVWYVKIKPEDHLDSFRAIEKYLNNTYGVIIDPSGKDVSRLRYVSYDPSMYYKKRSKTWTKKLTKKDREVFQPKSIVAYHSDDIEHIMVQIQDRNVNIAEDYHSWLSCAFALADEFKEQGREYFHIISRPSSKYDQAQTDKQYDIALKRESSGVTMGTFFHYCKEHGVSIMTPVTKATIGIYQQRVKMGRDRKEAGKSTLEFMQKMHNVGKEQVLPVIKKLEEVSEHVLNTDRVNDKSQEMATFLRQQNLRRNTITNKVELDGKRITDYDVNSIYFQAMNVIDYTVNKRMIWDLIDSSLVPSYNPFLEFFEKHGHLRPKGVIAEALDCFHYEKPEDFPADKDYLEVYMTKWLMGIISSMHGIHSVLTLVLVGEQGTGKTKFFRDLLPDELLKYYTENKLDGGKDTDMLMCEFLMIIDDEFGGKSKLEAKLLKELSSRDTFYIREPYGRTFKEQKRLAVLGGTSNDREVLNDATGNRRVIPVDLIKFDHERFKGIDKIELFIELYHIWKEIGDDWMLKKADIDLLNTSTVMNEQVPIEEELLLKFMEPAKPGDINHTFMTNTDILIALTNVSQKAVTVRQKNLGLILGKLGYKKERRKLNGVTKTVYCVINNIVNPPGFGPKSDENDTIFDDF